MESLIGSVESSIKTGNWYTALVVSLTLPDIAGKIETPSDGSQNRYVKWFNKYVRDKKYKKLIGAERSEYIFLSGNDCYALRCSYLHEGKTDITCQKAREVL